MPCCPPRPDSWVATALKPPGLLVFLAHKRNNPYRFTTGLRLHVSLDCGASSLNAPPKQLPDGASEPTREALLAALAERDRELAEVRARQTATAEILRVISQSPADAQPVFESIVLTAVRLLGCGLAAVLLCDGGSFYPVAEASRAGVHTSKMGKTPIDPGDNFPSRAIVAKEKLYLPDWSRIDLPGHERRVREIMGVNSALYLPLLRRGECFGLLALIGERADMFGPSEIALAEAFRDQAGIAIENKRQFNETKEALEQQTATAEILKVIAGSPSDVQPVLEAIATSAVRLVGGLSAAVWRFDDGVGYLAAYTPVNPAADAALKALSPMPFASFPIFARLLDGEAVAVVDTETDATLRDSARLRGYRSLLFTPLMSGRTAIGLISVTRGEPGVFAPHHVQLLRSFADQAVIAIQNTQLFNETKEALERQTATADVLKVISRSAFDLQTVLETLIHSAVELCAANRGAIFLRDGDVFSWRAATGAGDEYAAYMRAHPQIGGRGSTVGRVILSGKVECIPDVLDDREFMLPANALVQTRATLGAPLLRDGKVEGVLVLTRHSPGPFTRRQIELVETFADQAVIAIENVRLFDEVQARTREITESLEQQTAAAEILRVISSSPTDLQPVFDAIARSASELCEGSSSQVFLYRNGVIDIVAHHKAPDEALVGALSTFPAPPDPGTASGRAILRRAVIHIPDIVADPEYSASSIVKAGLRTILSVPMLRNGEPIGVVNATRTYSRPYTDRQIELLKTFADQAVIAINNVGLFNETQEALKQQTATAEVLKVISRSAFDLQAVLDTLVQSAANLCDAEQACVFQRDGDLYRWVSNFGFSSELVAYAEAHPFAAGLGSTTSRVALEGRTIHNPDVLADPSYTASEYQRLGNYRSMLGVPLLREGAPIGVFVLTRQQVRPFTGRQIELVQSFADQAVIAIENVRLFDEVQARTRDLSEALQQQTATADVLKVISRSVFDLDTVLQTLIDTAVRLTHGSRGTIFIKQGDVLAARAFHHNVPDSLRAYLASTTWSLDGDSHMARAAREGRVVHIADLSQSDKTSDEETRKRAAFGAGLWAPLMRDGQAIGVFGVPREEPIAFSDREIELVKTFADQAVIAIENVRLFDEVQAKTRDLSEALQQQTATADVLKAISRTAFDLDTVLETLISTAVRLCDASHGQIFRRHGDVYRYAASQMVVDPIYRRHEQATEIKPGRGTLIGRVALENRTVLIADAWNDPEYEEKAEARVGNVRAMLGVPLMRGGEPIGAFALARSAPVPFTQRQVELVTTFADQAVIAIENVRLFDEVQARTRDLSESLQQQTATADVLKVISRSAFDLQAVLDTLVQSAQRLCNARGSMIFVRDGEVYRIAAHVGMPEAFVSFRLANPLRADKITAVGRVALTGEMVHLADALADPDIQKAGPQLGDFRAVLSVPLVREDEVVGIFALNRPEPGLFAPGQVKLVQTFADQAAIAVANVRLFNEVKTKTDDLSEALQQQTATADVLKVISRSAFDLQAVLDTLVESAVSLIDASSGVIWLRDGDVFNVKAVSGAEGMQEFFAQLRTRPQKPGRHSIGARVLLTGEVQIVSDIKADLEYDPVIKAASNARTLLGVPLLRDGVIIGAFVLALHRLGTFTPRQIELVQTFADQAVIAIENVRLFEEVQARTRDLSEALQQQTATADVLKVISRSAFDLDAVLQTLVESAARLCNAPQGVIHLREGDVVRAKAMVGHSGELMQRLRDTPRRAGRESIVPRVMLSGRVEHIGDALTDPEFDLGGMDRDKLGFRGLLGVPLLREGKVEGVFVVSKPQPGRFTDRQTELVQTFADQAVIAIENVRLFKEVQTKTDDLSEALQQQTATADVLKVISRSAFDVQAVLDTLVESAYRLSGAAYGLIYLKTGEQFECKAIGGMGADEGDALFKGRPIRAGRSTAAERVILTGEIQSIPDLFADPEFDPKIKAAIRGAVDPAFASLRSLIAVPMKRDDAVVGVIVIARAQSGLLPARQLELLQTFADQAVIAIENARLFDEVQARTHDLSEALQQQTATADVLKVISRSAFDLQAVFDTLIASAVELCAAFSGTICVRDGDVFRYTGSAGAGNTVALHNYLEQHPATPGRASMVGRVLLSGKVERIRDRLEDDEYAVPTAAFGNISRAFLGVPLLGKGGIEGALVLTRREPGYFSDRQIEIVQTFADQAVIAIENVRLFDEVQARTRELVASLDDLRKTQDRLIQSEKLASLGQLTAGIAHEIKNPLNFVNNFSALSRELIDELAELLEKAPLQTDQRKEASELIGMVSANLEKVVQHGKRADSIVKNMLLHSREGSGERSSVKVNAMVEEALNLAYHGARAEKPGFNVTIVKSLAADAGAADLYPQEMTRVLLNLISNGFYATTKRRPGESNGAYEPTITASTRDLGHSVEIAIRDNGTGIPEEVKAKMFNPFFTTKPAGEGTGLGLSLSHDIVVKQHGGTLEVATEPGAYTQFTIVLPRGGATS
jgi:GAF domain-containing protein